MEIPKGLRSRSLCRFGKAKRGVGFKTGREAVLNPADLSVNHGVVLTSREPHPYNQVSFERAFREMNQGR